MAVTPVTSWDARTGWRALQIAVVLLVVTWLLTAATDEGGVAWGVRAGRALPLAPVCAMIGTWLALVPARARGEVRALETLGRTPWDNARGAVAGSFAVALLAAVAIAWVPKIDVTGFYPVAASADDYVFVDGAFVCRDSRMRILASGEAVAPRDDAPLEPAPKHLAIPRHGRTAAGLATALAGLALPMLAARARGRRARTIVGTLVLALLTTLLFQAAAASRVPALAAALPTLALLWIAVSRYRDGPWKTTTAV